MGPLKLYILECSCIFAFIIDNPGKLQIYINIIDRKEEEILKKRTSCIHGSRIILYYSALMFQRKRIGCTIVFGR